MNITRWAVIGFSVIGLGGCAQTPATIAKMSDTDIANVLDKDLCRAVNSSRRSAVVVAEVKRRQAGCDSIVNHCLGRHLMDPSPEFSACVKRIEDRWAQLRDAHDRAVAEREMQRLGDPMQQQRDNPPRIVCRVVTDASGNSRQVCSSQ